MEERHRHRYEVNNAYRDDSRQPGSRSPACPLTAPRGVHRAPRETHPFFVATQAHPEFLSRPTRPHPLFGALIAAALARSRAGEAGARAVATA